MIKVGKQVLFRQLELFEAFFPDNFLPWLRENYHVFEEFSAVADELWNKGVRKNSINMVREVTRFRRVMANQPTNSFTNTMTPYLGRAYAVAHPSRAALFDYVKDGFDFAMAVDHYRRHGTLT